MKKSTARLGVAVLPDPMAFGYCYFVVFANSADCCLTTSQTTSS